MRIISTNRIPFHRRKGLTMADSADLLAFINTYSWSYDAPPIWS